LTFCRLWAKTFHSDVGRRGLHQAAAGTRRAERKERGRRRRRRRRRRVIPPKVDVPFF
jgi:hypothetical protein